MQVANTKVGTDPELFLKRGKVIIGSERVIPEGGLTLNYGKIVRDGIQLELHPLHGSVETVMTGIRESMTKLNAHLGADTKVCFDPLVDVSIAEIESLSEESRRLGCQPSENYWGLKPLKVDPMVYRKRSAGGHIHLGLTDFMKEYRVRIVPILDILLGIPCVLLDRNPAQIERRKLYGRVGEYRTPEHGLEYRTLSNFWLHTPALTEFVLGMAKMCVDLTFSTALGQHGNLEQKLLGDVDRRSLVRAIQTNSFDMAWKIWERHTRPFISTTCISTYPLYAGALPNFERLVKAVSKNGLGGVFGADPIANWTGSKDFGKLWNQCLGRY